MSERARYRPQRAEVVVLPDAHPELTGHRLTMVRGEKPSSLDMVAAFIADHGEGLVIEAQMGSGVYQEDEGNLDAANIMGYLEEFAKQEVSMTQIASEVRRLALDNGFDPEQAETYVGLLTSGIRSSARRLGVDLPEDKRLPYDVTVAGFIERHKARKKI